MFRLLEESAVMVVQVEDFIHLSTHQVMERAALQQGVPDIADSHRGKPDTHVVKVVDVFFQIFAREVARHTGKVVQQMPPVDASRFREFQQGGDVPVDFEKHDIRKRQRAVRYHALELHTEAFRLVTYLHQIAAPVDGRLRRA